MSTPSRKERLLEMLAKSPNDSFLLYGAAMEFVKEGDLTEGNRRLVEVAEKFPQYHAAHFQLAQLAVDAGDNESAKNWLTAGITAANAAGNAHAAGEMEGMLLTLE